MTNSLIYLRFHYRVTKPLTQYGRVTGKHWRELLPKRVAALEANGQLHERLLEAEEKTGEEMDRMRRQKIQQDRTAQHAHDSAWEMARTR